LLDSLLQESKMSMLSEPRRRQKWSLNPRGNLWSKDENKLGQKLMEKMGYEKGKGLGAKQDGMLDPILVRQKEDNKGVGFEGHDDTWLAHQEDFQAVLAALNEAHAECGENANKTVSCVKEKDDESSLEKASKKSKKRVHYHKFTRGKDLSNYSADDLGCILGTNSTKSKDSRKTKSEPVSPAPEEESEEDNKVEEKKDERFTVQQGSYQEYFAKKMAALKAQGKPSYNPDSLENVKEVEVVEKNFEGELSNSEKDGKKKGDVEKKKKSKKRKAENVETQEVILLNVEEEKKLKKKNKEKKRLEAQLPQEVVDSNQEIAVENCDKKSKKKKIKHEKECSSISNTDYSVQESELSTKEKKKKKAKKEKQEEECPVEEIQNDSGCEQTEPKLKKKKREKKKKDKISPEEVNDDDLAVLASKRKSENQEDLDMDKPPKKKKKK